jgi:transposase
LKHYVEHAHAKNDWSTVRRIAVDETSARRGRSYVTMCSTMKTHVSAPAWSTGCGVQALGAFAEALRRHGGDPSQIEAIAMDMSTSYIKGASQYFPPASIVFDKFHVMVLAGKARKEVCLQLQREGAELKGAMWRGFW